VRPPHVPVATDVDVPVVLILMFPWASGTPYMTHTARTQRAVTRIYISHEVLSCAQHAVSTYLSREPRRTHSLLYSYTAREPLAA
jgi:hypothetical protein